MHTWKQIKKCHKLFGKPCWKECTKQTKYYHYIDEIVSNTLYNSTHAQFVKMQTDTFQHLSLDCAVILSMSYATRNSNSLSLSVSTFDIKSSLLLLSCSHPKPSTWWYSCGSWQSFGDGLIYLSSKAGFFLKLPEN